MPDTYVTKGTPKRPGPLRKFSGSQQVPSILFLNNLNIMVFNCPQSRIYSIGILYN